MGKRSRPGLLAALRSGLHWANRHAGWLFLAGLAAVVIRQWRLWQKDKRSLSAIKAAPPLHGLESWPRLPKVSALVAAWNEAGNIQAHIESFLALRYPHKQLVLVAGGSDGTFEIAQKYAEEQVFVMQQIPGEGKQRALRRGLERTDGEIIYLTDADCLLSDQAFESVLTPLIKGEALAATGRFRPLPGQENQPFVQMQWCIDNYGRAWLPAHIQGLIGRNATLARRLLAVTGDFQETVLTGTDYFLAQQILASGQSIAYVHDSMVATAFHNRPQLYLRQQSRWLRNILIHAKQFQSQDQYRSALGQCLSGILVLSVILLAPFSGIFLAFAGLLVAYGTLARWRYLYFGKHTLNIHIHKAALLLAPATFLLDQVMLVYALFTMLNRPHRTRW